MKRIFSAEFADSRKIAFFSVSVLVLLLPLLNYAHNYREVEINSGGVAITGITLVLILCVMLFLLIVGIPKSSLVILEVVLVWLATASWLQSNFLEWRGPILDGRLISSSSFHTQLLSEIVLWFGVLVVVSYIRIKFLTRGLLWLSAYLFLAGSIVVITELLNVDRDSMSFQVDVGFDEAAIVDLSANENVFFFILDEMQNNYVEKALSQEDLKEKYKDFTFFTDVVGGYQATIPSIPLIFSGEFYDNSGSYTEYARNAFSKPDSMLSVFKSNGYEINIIPYVPHTFYPELKQHDNGNKPPGIRFVNRKDVSLLMDLSLFAMMPGFVKKYIYNDAEWLFSEEKRTAREFSPSELGMPAGVGDEDTALIGKMILEANTESDKKKFFAVHFSGAHVPFNMDADGNRISPSETEQGYEYEITYKLRLFGRFLDLLKEHGVYDRSAIIMIGDHGSGRTPSTQVFRQDPGRDLPVKARATPLLMAKGIGNSNKELNFIDTPISFESLSEDIYTLVTNPEDLTKKPDVIRRYVHFKWTAQFKDYLPDYREYMVAGNVRNNSSWMPIHIHDENFSQKDRCLFGHPDQQYLFTREGLTLLSKDSIYLEDAGNSSFLFLKIAFDRRQESSTYPVEVFSDGVRVLSQKVRTKGVNFTEAIRVPVDRISNTVLQVRSPEALSISGFLLVSKLNEAEMLEKTANWGGDR